MKEIYNYAQGTKKVPTSKDWGVSLFWILIFSFAIWCLMGMSV